MSNHLTPPDRPTGTVTFLFTDIEGSTRLWEEHADLMPHAFARHEAIIRDTVAAHGGYAYKMIGDAFQVAFQSAPAALQAAVAIQRAFTTAPWGEIGALKVRVALHTGSVEERGDDYVGPLLNRVARLMAVGHGGQILLTEVTAALAHAALPQGIELRDLGFHCLKNLIQPERVLQVVDPDLSITFPPLRSVPLRSLPLPLTPLIGRENEVNRLCTLFDDEKARLVTLTGPGGTGKTRLSLEVARQLQSTFRDGVYFVELAPISKPDLVTDTIAKELKVQEVPTEPLHSTLKTFLEDKSLLLVLDNFEQIIAAAPLIAELVIAAPAVRVLVSSREPLRVRGEQVFEVSPLMLPDLCGNVPVDRLIQSPAITLFVQRAQAVKSTFTLTEENAPAICEICVRLDGLPLAIELAAARIRLYTLEAMLAALANRFRWLSGPRDAPQRHQTLQALMAWSYDLLTETEQRLFRCLGVFVGGFTLDAAETVCDQEGDLIIEEGVLSLLDKNLLRAQERAGGEPRFTMLETIRQYASEQLAADPKKLAVQRAHAEHYLNLVENADNAVTPHENNHWLTRLDGDDDNLRAAIGWAIQRHETDLAIRLAGASHHLWYSVSQFAEKKRWLEQVLLLAEDAPDGVKAKVYSAMGTLLWRRSDFAAAAEFHLLSLLHYRQAGDDHHAAWALNNLGVQTFEQGDFARAGEYLDEGLTLARATADPWITAHLLENLGELARCTGDNMAARRYIEDATVLYRETGDLYNLAATRHNLGHVLCHEGELGQATAAFREGLRISSELKHKEGISLCLAGLAGVAGIRQKPADAARLFGASAAFRDTAGTVFNRADLADHDRNLAAARAQLDDAAWEPLWQEGYYMSSDEAILLAQGS